MKMTFRHSNREENLLDRRRVEGVSGDAERVKSAVNRRSLLKEQKLLNTTHDTQLSRYL